MVVALCALACAPAVPAAERVLLRNGFSVDCHHRESAGAGRTRLVLDAGGGNYMDVDSGSIVSSEVVEAPTSQAKAPLMAGATVRPVESASLPQMIAAAGAARNINVELLQSVVNAESGGHVRATSHAGAQGLMQLMPSTARALGVHDSFAPEENLRGGTAYLDALLTRYHNDLALALAAYNAGPGAVDRYHGVPPYRETVLYVSRIIREFNRRTLLAQKNAQVKPQLAEGSMTR